MSPIYYLFLVVALWLVLITIFLAKTVIHYRRLTADVSKKDLLTSLNHLISISEQNSSEIDTLKKNLSHETDQNKLHFQRLGFQRYNPFTDTGGDQSFTMTLLDDFGNGFVISSLHSRENTRIYAKKIENGIAVNQVLSKEEQEVIKQSLK